MSYSPRRNVTLSSGIVKDLELTKYGFSDLNAKVIKIVLNVIFIIALQNHNASKIKYVFLHDIIMFTVFFSRVFFHFIHFKLRNVKPEIIYKTLLFV